MKKEKSYELINFCEFDKYATKSYCAIHNVDECKNLGDITKVNEKEIEDFNMMTWGFPCTDISVAGKMNGFVDEYGNITRSGMYYEGIRILKEKKPSISIIENVKNLTSKKFKKEFETVLNDLDEAGYNSYWKVLNAKNYGVPQNRERVFIISIRKELDNGKFNFPKEFDNGIRLKDILENEVDEKYYINTDRAKQLIDKLIDSYQLQGDRECADSTINEPKIREISNCITSRYDAGIQNQKQIGLVVVEPNMIQVGKLEGSNFNQNKVVYDIKDISPTLIGQGHCGNVPKIAIEDNKINILGKFEEWHQRGNVYNEEGVMGCLTATDYKTPKLVAESIICEQRCDEGLRFFKDNVCGDKRVIETTNELQLFTNLSGGKWDKIHESARRVYKEDGISPTIPTCQGGNIEPKVFTKYRIRKLTPKECWRLMGFSDKDIDKCIEIRISNTQLYKQAGNSIVVDVLYYIYLELYKAMPYLFDNLKLSSFFSGIGAFEKALDRLYESINTGNFTHPQVN